MHGLTSLLGLLDLSSAKNLAVTEGMVHSESIFTALGKLETDFATAAAEHTLDSCVDAVLQGLRQKACISSTIHLMTSNPSVSPRLPPMSRKPPPRVSDPKSGPRGPS